AGRDRGDEGVRSLAGGCHPGAGAPHRFRGRRCPAQGRQARPGSESFHHRLPLPGTDCRKTARSANEARSPKKGMSPKKGISPKKPAKKPAMESGAFTAEERAAMKERVRELKGGVD